MGGLYPSPLEEEPSGALYANPMLARQVAAQRLTPKAGPIFPNALTSWGQLGPALNNYARQNFPIDSPEAVKTAAFNAAMGVGPLATVYHGSPHKFDKFDMSKVGTGEGAQAYGHGLYFAENKGVAANYRDALAVPKTPEEAAAQYLSSFKGDRAAGFEVMQPSGGRGTWP